MLDYDEIEQWRRSVSSPYQLDVANAVLDCSSATPSTVCTPERPPLRLVCPPAPKKPKYDFSVIRAGKILFDMKSQGTQTEQSLGTCRVRGMAMHLLRIHYGCPTCNTLLVGDTSPPICSFCGQPMHRSVGTNVGLYHLVPYFE